MAEHVFTNILHHAGLISASSVSSYPCFVAPYSGYIQKIHLAGRTAVVADQGSATTGEVSIRFKNERSGNYLNAAKNLVGVTALSATSVILDQAQIEVKKGDVITYNQTVSAVSGTNAGPGVLGITFHVSDSRYGGQIAQAFSPQD